MIQAAICILFISIISALPSTEEQKLLSEIAICVISGKANWQNFASLSSGQNTQQIQENLFRVDELSIGQESINTNELMNIADDMNNGYESVSAPMQKLSKQQAIFIGALNQPLDKTSRFNPQQIYEWEDSLNNAPKMYDIRTRKTYTAWGDKQIKAQQGLKAYRATQNNDIIKKLKDIEQKVSATNSAATKGMLRKVRLKQLKDKLAFGSKLTVGLSAVINIKLLLNGEVLQYFGQISKDLAISTVCTGGEAALEEVGLNELAPGVGVVVFGLIDVVRASQTGDWSRFGLNFALNTGGAVGMAGGAYLGVAIGTAICPGIGTTIGGILGGLAGGIGARVGLGATQLGTMTDYESKQAVQKLAEELNPKLSTIGVELDTTKSFEEIQELLKNEEIPLKFSSELVNANGVSYNEIANVLGNDLMKDLLDTASMISPQARIEGLKQVKRGLGC